MFIVCACIRSSYGRIEPLAVGYWNKMALKCNESILFDLLDPIECCYFLHLPCSLKIYCRAMQLWATSKSMLLCCFKLIMREVEEVKHSLVPGGLLQQMHHLQSLFVWMTNELSTSCTTLLGQTKSESEAAIHELCKVYFPRASLGLTSKQCAIFTVNKDFIRPI